MVPPSVLRSQDDDLQRTTFCSIWLHHTRKSLHVAVFNWEYVYAVKTANLRREVKKAETQQRLHKASWPFQYHLKHTHKVLSGNTCLNTVFGPACVSQPRVQTDVTETALANLGYFRIISIVIYCPAADD